MVYHIILNYTESFHILLNPLYESISDMLPVESAFVKLKKNLDLILVLNLWIICLGNFRILFFF